MRPRLYPLPRRLMVIGIARALAVSGLATAQPIATVIENDLLKVQCISPGGTVSLVSKPEQRTFLSFATLGESAGVARATNITNRTFGQGQAIEVTYPGGNRDRIMLFPKLPFALFRPALHNGGREIVQTHRVRALSAPVDLGKPPDELRTFGTGGLLPADKNPGSYAWLAAVEPQSRNGVVFGWLTHERASGVLFSKVEHGRVQVDAVLEYGKLRLATGRSEELETLAIGYFDDARLGLETWADAVAKVYDVHLKPQPTGYCTWYSKPYGGAADEQHLAELAAFSATNLAPYGFSVVQIDDGWQAGFKRTNPSSPKKDFRAHNPKGPYPNGMKVAADRLHSLGLVPGIWFMPFAGTVGDPFFDGHLDWFAKTPDGKPYDTPWGGACLDMTDPGARDHVRGVVSRICREWGYRYIKIDGLWTGTATKQLYVNSGYKPDDLGEALLKNPDKTGIEAFRDGLKLVREAAGRDVFILGCNAPQNMRSYGGAFGLVDAMRIGPDNKADWKSLLRGPTFGTRHYFLHRRLWYNDPDPVYVRESIPLNHARLICSWVALSGQLNLSSEWIPGLPADRLDILKRTMPPHHGVARPVDLFDTDLPRVWTVTQAPAETPALPPGAPNRMVVGMFNWNSEPQQFDLPLERLGLPAHKEYVAFDYWGNKFLPALNEKLAATVPGESCLILAVREKTNHPQVVSTSRHVTQGLIEVSDEKWNQASGVLSGRCDLVGQDACELRICTGPARLVAADVGPEDNAAGASASFVTDGSIGRVTLKSRLSRRVFWKAQFK